MERITELNFEMMSGKYQKEQLEIEARLKEVMETLNESYEKSQGIRDFLSLIRNYQGLKKLDATFTRNIYSQDIIESFEGIYQIEQGIFKRKVTLAGQAEYEKIKMNMIDAVKFIYDNILLYSHFAEHKNYIRTLSEKIYYIWRV